MLAMHSGVWALLWNEKVSQRYDSSEEQDQAFEGAPGPG
jgi:hypothetical protein